MKGGCGLYQIYKTLSIDALMYNSLSSTSTPTYLAVLRCAAPQGQCVGEVGGWVSVVARMPACPDARQGRYGGA